MPSEAYPAIAEELDPILAIRYHKTVLSLSDILSTPFLSAIKTTPLHIISPHQAANPVNTSFSVSNGILRIDVDKENYQRCGLAGTAYSAGGKKHRDNRYVIEADLRAPSMLHGRKGFERYVYAAREVITQSEVCLLAGERLVYVGERDNHESQVNGVDENVQKVLEKYKSDTLDAQLAITTRERITTPGFLSDMQNNTQTLETMARDSIYINELEDWLSLVALDSPRVRADDKVDPYVSRYAAPDDYGGTQVTNLAHADVSGFIPSSTITQVMLALRRRRGPHWVAMQAQGFQDNAVTVLLLPGREEAFVWEHFHT